MNALSSPTRSRLTIIIVNWNSRDYLKRCLESLVHAPPSVPHDIVVVDSGSFDGSGRMVLEEFPDVLFVQSPENIGFAAANNLGTRYASAPLLLFLNPDCEVLPGAIDELLKASEALPMRGVVGCRLLNTDGSLQASCVMPRPTIFNQLLDSDFLQRHFPRCRLWQSALTYDDADGPVSVDAVSGACMLVSQTVFASIGRFTTDYFMYAEDLDLCWKARRAGWSNYYVGSARIVHHGGGSSSQSRSSFASVMMRESLRRLLRRVRGPAYAGLYRATMGLNAASRLALLAVASPAMLALHRTSRWRSASRKWMSVLRWSLGLESWVKAHGIARE